MVSYSAERLIRIAISISREKQIDSLLDRILVEAMDITQSDGGVVYIREGDELVFHNMITRSKNVHKIRKGSENFLPPIPMGKGHVCACAAIEHKRFNIPDVYGTGEYDFSGSREYDNIHHYHTKSMLVIPMEDDHEKNIGVLQLINAQDVQGNIIPFNPEYENIIMALASLAAISLNNTQLQRAVFDILHSFVSVMVDAIDARSPYNAKHTKSMVSYADRFISWLNHTDHGWRFTPEEKDAYLMSVWLHDIGKLVIPLEIMDKPTRLGKLEERILARVEVALLREKITALENPAQAQVCRQKADQLREALQTLKDINRAGYLDDALLGKAKELGRLTCQGADGQTIPFLTQEEQTAIFVRKGTLTAAERREMERHVVYTKKLLDRMKFSGIYERVPNWASCHHELLDGSGYPDHLRGEELPRQVRLLTILDIYDALTAEDRPYRPPFSPQKAFEILWEMEAEGKLDGEILTLFQESEAWKDRDGNAAP